ncbi:hypothetical protein V8F33_007004 [Rhypophila sp. PSN 637]
MKITTIICNMLVLFVAAVNATSSAVTPPQEEFTFNLSGVAGGNTSVGTITVNLTEIAAVARHIKPAEIQDLVHNLESTDIRDLVVGDTASQNAALESQLHDYLLAVSNYTCALDKRLDPFECCCLGCLVISWIPVAGIVCVLVCKAQYDPH